MEAYDYLLLDKNIGSKVYLKVDEDGRFQYFIVAFGTYIRGFAHMLKIIAVQDRFLNYIGGYLLCAVAQDIKNQNFSIAFHVVDKEYDASWTYFLNSCVT